MEFTNEISFNKNLIQNESIEITYSGKLFKEFSSEITIVYGFGANWDYTSETKMNETENGFVATIELKPYDTFNFCFRNNYNVWDNNSSFNYIAAISPKAEIDESAKENNIVEEISQPEETNDSVEANIQEEMDDSTDDTETIDENNDFDDLLNSILQFDQTPINENVNLENGFGLQSVDEIEDTDFTSCSDIFQELYDELAVSPSEPAQIEEIKSEPQEELQTKTISVQELDEIMENILNSIIEETNTTNEVSELPAEIKETNPIKHFFKNAVNGCKKIGALFKRQIHKLIGEEE